MATEALALTPNGRDIDLEEALVVAVALARGSERDGPVVHGDFAPWNLLRTPDGVGLVDWESSRFELDPLYDLAHFVTSKGALLSSHQPADAVRLLTAEASPGWRYLEALDCDPRPRPTTSALPGADRAAGHVHDPALPPSHARSAAATGGPPGVRSTSPVYPSTTGR